MQRFLRGFATKANRYTPEAQAILQDTMVPGAYLKYLKNRSNKDKTKGGSDEVPMYTEPARSMTFGQKSDGPTQAQMRLADRVRKAMIKVQAVEDLPTSWLSQLRVADVKVARNLRRCQIEYEPIANEQGKVHNAVRKHSRLLNTLINQHAQTEHTIHIKFISHEHKDIDEVYNTIEKELGSL
ncbi:hypothetical protein RMATCC62417_11987 [Rhizopus microsporus]|nr:hypothetical protein RMATCC62417_11987 [Rhizopus microsporus]